MNEEERIPSGIAADAERLERSGWTVDSASAAAKSAALEALGALPAPEPVASVSYMSHGRLLLIGPPEARDSMFATALSFRRELDVHVLCPERGPPLDTHSVLVWGGKLQSLTGYLGNFTVKWNGVTSESQPATSATGPVTLARSGDTPVVQFDAMQKCYTGHFDLVLDFSLPAQFRMHQPPQGYFAVGRDVDKLQSACAELSGMVGEFEKPRFFSYKEKLCAHSRAHQQGCNRCIDVCSTAAISAAGDFVAVDAHLCMGCGACATVCPSGAMSFQYPRVSDRGAQIKALLASYRVAGGGNACLLLHNGTDGRDLLAASARDGRGIPGYVIPVPVWHIASTGIDLLLGAVSYGATHVALLSTGSEAPEYAAALLEQMGHAQTILNALGYQGKHFSLLEARTAPQIEAALGDISAAMTPAVATFNLSGDKRTTLEFCLEHLAGHAPAPQQEIALARGAPYGRIDVDAAKCTLCMACAGACPEGALRDSPDAPRLKFIERHCVQCGLCENTCPEHAITLTPRLLLAPQWKQEVVVAEAEPFFCISCGKALGTRQMVDAMLARLSSHPMFSGADKLRLLQMCADCRVVDMMNGKEEFSMLNGKQP